ncbi:hypothetical protein GCM10011579_076260 [Streptomyces albiflavescens]|uniref:Uncharacterized protein n=1 Tax=Streptomyces albiflavescens TaxID=1623582 RepID=A0A917YBK2_9ACTN|nr:hypothetical protein [Streptomyces albiflavescens]GGN85351.1 hypothetical protein GCM10011579_076260 [Streptomyces albiflavescens]
MPDRIAPAAGLMGPFLVALALVQARLVAIALADRTGGALDTAGTVRDGNG